MKLLITGAHGLVGYALIPKLEKLYTILRPMRSTFDLLDISSIEKYIAEEKPDLILHAGAYVKAQDAEKERNNKDGICWKTNVIGTQAVVEAARINGAFVLYISTGSVFHGTKENPGPFEIVDQPEKNPDNNNWYGFTKYQGELSGPDAIVRISHPLIPDAYRNKDDYVHKMLHLYEQHSLFPIFYDQLFPLTVLEDLFAAITKILEEKVRGVFHVASPDMVSPYELFTHILTIVGKPIDERIVRQSIQTFYEDGNSQLRFAQYSALSSKKTEELISLQFAPWKEGISRLFSIDSSS